jgi:hypothetical protein
MMLDVYKMNPEFFRKLEKENAKKKTKKGLADNFHPPYSGCNLDEQQTHEIHTMEFQVPEQQISVQEIEEHDVIAASDSAGTSGLHIASTNSHKAVSQDLPDYVEQLGTGLRLDL